MDIALAVGMGDEEIASLIADGNSFGAGPDHCHG